MIEQYAQEQVVPCIEGKSLWIEEFHRLNQEAQMQYLYSNIAESILMYPSAMLACNRNKNRYENVLPNEKTRVHLVRATTTSRNNDYINANYIFNNMQYIATQAPLAETTEDFWWMVWQHKSVVIIMLTALMETQGRRIKATQYWPERVGTSVQYGPLTVHFAHQSSLQVDLICRAFVLSCSEQTQQEFTHSVVQLQYTGWPDSGVPPSTDAILGLCNLSNRLRCQFGTVLK